MEKQWFVLHTLSGQEMKVKESIERRIKTEEMGDYIDEVLVPTEKIYDNAKPTKGGRRATTTRKFYPGYVLVHMTLYDDQRQLVDKTWYFTQQTPGIIGFVGGDRPVPLRPAEVETIMRQIEEKKDRIKPKVEFEPGETVKINDGPFLNFSGVIEEIDPERGKLKVSVSIFGRSAPVELEYWQVERAT